MFLNQNLTPETQLSSNPYSEKIFNALSFRFEEPNGNNRWDKPLLLVEKPDTLENYITLYENIIDSLYNAKNKPVIPNNSTVAPAQNNLANIEKTTQLIIDSIIKSRRNNLPKVELPHSSSDNGKILISTPSNIRMTDNDLRRCRREFSKYLKAQVGQANKNRSNDEITDMFVKYLENSLESS